MSQLLYKPRPSTKGADNILRIGGVIMVILLGVGLYETYRKRQEEKTS